MVLDPQSEVEAMVARVQQSAHQIHMIAADMPPLHRGDADSGVSWHSTGELGHRVNKNLG